MVISSTMRGVFSFNGEIDLRGSPQALSLFADHLIEFASPLVINLDAVEANPAPYDRWLESIEVEISDRQTLLIARSNAVLRMSGSVEALMGFGRDISSFVSNLQSTQRGAITRHIHIEPMEHDEWIDSSSAPLVISEAVDL